MPHLSASAKNQDHSVLICAALTEHPETPHQKPTIQTPKKDHSITFFPNHNRCLFPATFARRRQPARRCVVLHARRGLARDRHAGTRRADADAVVRMRRVAERARPGT